MKMQEADCRRRSGIRGNALNAEDRLLLYELTARLKGKERGS